jgi:hypothetical protein
MKKYISILFLLTACNDHVCPPPFKVRTNYDTVMVPRIDTLVIIQTYDSVPVPSDTSSSFYIRWGGWEEAPGSLFKDGKRIDTIRKHTIILL